MLGADGIVIIVIVIDCAWLSHRLGAVRYPAIVRLSRTLGPEGSTAIRVCIEGFLSSWDILGFQGLQSRSQLKGM